MANIRGCTPVNIAYEPVVSDEALDEIFQLFPLEDWAELIKKRPDVWPFL